MNEITIKGMSKAQLVELIEKTLADIREIHSSVEEIDLALNRAEEADDKINSGSGFLKSIEQSAVEVDDKLQKIKEAYGQICEDDGGGSSIKNELENLIALFKEDKKSIDKFKDEIWGDEQEGEERDGGIFGDIEKFHREQQEKYNELYNRIEVELLSGATAVNLAKVFESKVSEFKKAGDLWGGAFVVLILGFVVYYGFATFSTDDVNTLSDVWLHIFFRSPFLLFGIWLAVFLGSRRAESKKLEESYKHKEVMARSFTGYKEAMKDLDTEDQELLKAHMNNLLSTMNIDSSEFLTTKGENHPLHDFIQGGLGKKGDK